MENITLTGWAEITLALEDVWEALKDDFQVYPAVTTATNNINKSVCVVIANIRDERSQQAVAAMRFCSMINISCLPQPEEISSRRACIQGRDAFMRVSILLILCDSISI